MNKTKPVVRALGLLSQPFNIVALAFLFKLSLFFIQKPFLQILPHLGDVRFWGFEAGRIAQHLVTGKGYAGAYATGVATSELEPLYPFLWFIIFKLFGVATLAAAKAMLILEVFISTWMIYLGYLIGAQFINKKTGVAFAWLLVFWPPFIRVNLINYFDCKYFIAPFLVVLLFYLLLKFYHNPSWSNVIILGIGSGIVLLTYSAPVLFILFLLFYFLLKRPDLIKKYLVSLLVAFLIILPWSIRNYLVFDKVIVFRGTLPFQLYLGNVSNDTGFSFDTKASNPLFDQNETLLYQKQGEVGYIQEKKVLFFRWLQKNPGQYLKLSLNRFYIFWTGTSFIKKALPFNEFLTRFWWHHLLYILPDIFLLFWLATLIIYRKIEPYQYFLIFVLLFVPLPYYLTHVHFKYRFLIEPLLLLVCVDFFLNRPKNHA